MRTQWYNREGNKITESEAQGYLGDPDYARVERTRVMGVNQVGRADKIIVSTIWLGRDFGMSSRPAIFETSSCRAGEEHQARVSRLVTEAEARQEHEQRVSDGAQGLSSVLVQDWDGYGWVSR